MGNPEFDLWHRLLRARNAYTAMKALSSGNLPHLMSDDRKRPLFAPKIWR